MDAETSTEDDAGPSATRPPGRPSTLAVALILALTPAITAVWWHRGFTTQDGSAHLYNAHVLARSAGADAEPTFTRTFRVRREPLPNWAGHLVLMFLSETLPSREADRAMATITLLAPALAVVGLRARTTPSRGRAGPALLASLLALNVAWLLGFSGFLLGASLFPATLEFWWAGRDEGWSLRHACGLAALLVLGYFCHLVSLGLTAAALVLLDVFTPGRSRTGRAATTLLGLTPLAPLAILYSQIMRRGGGGLAPEWKHLAGVTSPKAWADQLTWVDPISLAAKDYLPVVGTLERWHLAAAPVLWLGLAMALFIGATLAAGEGPFQPAGRPRRGWWAIAAVFLLAGTLSPDTLGPTHGEYLPQRIVLLGLMALVPVLRLDAPGRAGKLGLAALAVAWVAQCATVWDYARLSERTAGPMFQAERFVGQGQRIATRLTDLRSPFRASPLLHADCALGVDTGNIIWSDYETRFYYFPVQFRDGLDLRPDPEVMERIALARPSSPERATLWADLLRRHRRRIEVVVSYGNDPPLDAITLRWYRPLLGTGPVRVWRRREEPPR